MDVTATTIQSFNIFNSLTREELDYLIENIICREVNVNTTLYEEHCRISSLTLLLDGIIQQSKMGPKGRDVIIRYAKAGEIVGFRSMMTNELACTTTKTITKAKIGHINKDCVLNILYSNPQVSLKLIRHACCELDQTQHSIINHTQKQIRGRVAIGLLYLNNTFGLDEDGLLNISISRKDFAGLIGAAPESAVRMLSEFKDIQIIDFIGKKIRINNMETLLKYSRIC